MPIKIQQHVIPRGVSRHRRGLSLPARYTNQRGIASEGTLTVGFAVIALITVVVLGFFYLQQVFGTAAHGTNIQALEQTMMQLKEQQKELELDGAELRSIQSVEERVKDLNLVSANSVGYLAPRSNQVASRTTL